VIHNANKAKARNEYKNKSSEKSIQQQQFNQEDYVHSVSTLRYVRPAPSKCFYTFIILFFLTFLYNINTQDSDRGCRIEEEETTWA
jgi:hypothetical protein